jgi:phenylalanine-4-hydroxylase
MEFKSEYVSKQPNQDGLVEYTVDENEVWKCLYERQLPILKDRACDEHVKGLELLDFTKDNIPQLPNVNKKLSALTGWSVSPVSALISHEDFFKLLASRQFPAATFIRRKEDIDYIKEPDIFHELFGHCPILTVPDFADFVQAYAEKVLQLEEEMWPLMQRLFWFTVEFGLLSTEKGLRAYGGGILSSIGETVYSIDSHVPQRQLFDPVAVFRTPYRIDIMQPVYFVIDNYRTLYEFIQSDFLQFIEMARELGEFPALFPVDKDNPNIHIFAC